MTLKRTDKDGLDMWCGREKREYLKQITHKIMGKTTKSKTQDQIGEDKEMIGKNWEEIRESMKAKISL